MFAIMFGEEMIKNMPICQYFDPRTGEESTRTLEYTINNIASDLGYVAGHPLSRLFPFFKQYPLINPFYSLSKNSDTIYAELTKLCEKSTDSN